MARNGFGLIAFPPPGDLAHAMVNPLGSQSKRSAMWSIAVLSVIAAALIAVGFSVSFPDR